MERTPKMRVDHWKSVNLFGRMWLAMWFSAMERWSCRKSRIMSEERILLGIRWNLFMSRL